MGCRLICERYGEEVPRFANSDVGAELWLRGINAWVWKAGAVRRATGCGR